jgi:hypothetical protein
MKWLSQAVVRQDHDRHLTTRPRIAQNSSIEHLSAHRLVVLATRKELVVPAHLNDMQTSRSAHGQARSHDPFRSTLHTRYSSYAGK